LPRIEASSSSSFRSGAKERNPSPARLTLALLLGLASTMQHSTLGSRARPRARLRWTNGLRALIVRFLGPITVNDGMFIPNPPMPDTIPAEFMTAAPVTTSNTNTEEALPA
jgi:hypothetical protein